jgi:hypothetical protein
MDPRFAKDKMMQVVRETSGVEQDRTYLGMSQIGRCPQLLYRWMLDGKGEPSDKAHLNCMSGYQYEHEMLKILCGANLLDESDLFRIGKEIIAKFDSRFRGHIDAVAVDGSLVEIKTFNADDYNRVTRTNQLSVPYLWQVQAYMRYGLFDETLMVLVCRDPFTFWTMNIKRDDVLGVKIDEKAKMILAAVDTKTPPICTCGRCDAAQPFNHPQRRATAATTQRDYGFPVSSRRA